MKMMITTLCEALNYRSCPPQSTMKKKPLAPSPEVEEDHDLELLKAAAQAWHSRSGRTKTTEESDAHQQSHKTKPPTRFWLEAISKKPLANGSALGGAKWDFRESLWDSYEIVAVSRRLEAGMVLDDPFKELSHDKNSSRVLGTGKNSLRDLFNLMSSRRFVEPGDDQHKDKLEF